MVDESQETTATVSETVEQPRRRPAGRQLPAGQQAPPQAPKDAANPSPAPPPPQLQQVLQLPCFPCQAIVFLGPRQRQRRLPNPQRSLQIHGSQRVETMGKSGRARLKDG
jgi:hypothetical protein